MRRLFLFLLLIAGWTPAFAQGNPQIFNNRFAVGKTATLVDCVLGTMCIEDNTGRVQVIQTRAALSTTFPFLNFVHKTAAGAANSYEWQFRVNSSHVLDIYDATAAASRFSIDTSGAVTIPGGTTFSSLSASSLVATNASKALTSTVSGLSPGFTGLSLSGLTNSRLLASDGSNNLVSNGAITTGALPKSVSSGASLAASAVSDDGTNVTIAEPLIQSKNVQGNESTFALTSGAAAAAFATVAVPSNSAANIQVEYVLEASTATPHVQAFGGIVLFNAVNVGGTITCTNSTPTTSALATDGGTLTATFSCADATGGNMDLKVTDTSSITPTTNRIRYRLRALAATELVFTTH